MKANIDRLNIKHVMLSTKEIKEQFGAFVSIAVRVVGYGLEVVG